MSDAISGSVVSTPAAPEPQRHSQFLMDVPQAQRAQIASGMRWTVWLSAISLPFSYTTAILLARVSPEAIGTYGLLNVYIGIVLGLFYLGGDAVAIKFVPELEPQQRSSFLVTYYAVVCLATVPWIVAAALWPRGLHYLFGDQTNRGFEFFLIAIAPLCALTSLVGAALKSRLDIAWAQILIRLVTIGSFATYVALYFAARSFLAAEYAPIIWSTYLGLSAIAAGIGTWRLFGHSQHSIKWPTLRFVLPAGFWQYTLSLQQVSALSFVTQRLDAILILNFGGLSVLGKYVALVTLAESIRLVGKFFLDTLLPSLTNMIAARNLTAAENVFATHMRILFLVTTSATCGLILFAHPIEELFGRKYSGLASLTVILAYLIGISTPAGVGGILLSCMGKQQRGVWVMLVQTALYIAMFVTLWPRWQLKGAVIAYGTAAVFASLAGFVVAQFGLPFKASVIQEYSVFVLISTGAVLLSFFHPLGLLWGAIAWTFFVVLFLLFASYSYAECRNLFHFFVPVLSIARSIRRAT